MAGAPPDGGVAPHFVSLPSLAQRQSTWHKQACRAPLPGAVKPKKTQHDRQKPTERSFQAAAKRNGLDAAPTRRHPLSGARSVWAHPCGAAHHHSLPSSALHPAGHGETRSERSGRRRSGADENFKATLFSGQWPPSLVADPEIPFALQRAPACHVRRRCSLTVWCCLTWETNTLEPHSPSASAISKATPTKVVILYKSRLSRFSSIGLHLATPSAAPGTLPLAG